MGDVKKVTRASDLSRSAMEEEMRAEVIELKKRLARQ
jgi:hypothetical protein